MRSRPRQAVLLACARDAPADASGSPTSTSVASSTTNASLLECGRAVQEAAAARARCCESASRKPRRSSGPCAPRSPAASKPCSRTAPSVSRAAAGDRRLPRATSATPQPSSGAVASSPPRRGHPPTFVDAGRAHHLLFSDAGHNWPPRTTAGDVTDPQPGPQPPHKQRLCSAAVGRCLFGPPRCEAR